MSYLDEIRALSRRIDEVLKDHKQYMIRYEESEKKRREEECVVETEYFDGFTGEWQECLIERRLIHAARQHFLLRAVISVGSG